MRWILPWVLGAAEALATVFLVIAVAGGIVLMLRLRRHPGREALSITLRDMAVAGAIGIIAVATLLTPSVLGGRVPEVRIIPFAELLEALAGRSSIRFAVAEMVGNVALFVPLGMAVRWRFPGLGVWRVALVAMVCSIGVEVLQGVLELGRWPSTTDVIMNTLGGAIGAAIGSLGLAPARQA